MKRTVLTVLVAAALIAACSGGFPDEFEAPDFTLTAPMTGKQVTFYDLKGKPVILYWFASW